MRGAYVAEARAAGRLRGSKAETDAAYDAAAASLLEAAAAGDDVYAFLCTHNAASCEKALSKADALHLERGEVSLRTLDRQNGDGVRREGKGAHDQTLGALDVKRKISYSLGWPKGRGARRLWAAVRAPSQHLSGGI